MHFVYGLANGNARQARRIYNDRYPNRHVPHVSTFIRIHQRLMETGSFARKTNDIPGRPRTKTPALEEAVLNEIEHHPETSTRKIAADLHALLPRDFPQRLIFCRCSKKSHEILNSLHRYSLLMRLISRETLS
ncbi:hypothetical protein DMN91_011326 [Ooceraea biroi]|uniref:DUF4817 domain-containing protein n=1 Tax=Ooceraea biroi TaxID=2015173 RepID=A0A3L8D9U9_OOCBI|nr:hypothetical protein DMN91_011326 [Ooceraea biroi]